MIGRTLGPAPLSTSNLANFFYTRPPEFLDLAVIPEPGVTEMFTFLVAVFPVGDGNNYNNQITGAPTLSAVNNVALHCDVTNSGTWTVDWGDGTIENYATGANVFHEYDYNSLPASTEFRGYRQVVLSGYPTSVNDLFQEVKTDLDGPFTPGYTGETTRNGSNLLDIEISSRNATSMDTGGNTRPHKMCERIALYNTSSNRLTNPQAGFFAGMSNLQEVVQAPYMHADTTESHSEVFRHCYKLRFLPDDFADPDRYWFWNSTSMYLAFESCFKLEYLPEGIFTGRGQITELSNVQDYRYMWRYCYQICYIPELPSRTSGGNIRVQSTFQDCQYLKRLPKNFKANNVTSSSSGGLQNMLYNTLRLESFGDWNLLDMDSTAKQPNSINTLGYRYNCMRNTAQIVPWDGISLDVINSGTAVGTTVGAWRPTRGPQFFAKEFYDSGFIDLTNMIDLESMFNGNYCIKHYPIIKVSPNTLTNSNSIQRMFFNNYTLKTVSFSGMAVDETFGNGEYNQMFYNNYQLRSIDGLPWNAANDSGDYNQALNSVRNLGHFTFPGLSSDETGFSQSISLRYQPHDLQSIENIFRYLKTGSFTITLTNNNYADNIPADVLAIATDKGWTVTT
jgi:hypothetical protein